MLILLQNNETHDITTTKLTLSYLFELDHPNILSQLVRDDAILLHNFSMDLDSKEKEDI